MIEQIERLEQRVERLVQGLEQSRQHIRQLELENQRLTEQIHQLEQLEGRNQALTEQVHALEAEIETLTGEKTRIRSKLNQILERIDTIEQEARGGGS